MTDAQRRRYWNLWAAACRARGWRMAKGRLDLPHLNGIEDADTVQRTIANALARAAAAARAPVLDDLRHGAHVAALGRDKSSTRLNNADLDLLFPFFKLLARPLDLAASVELDHNPEEGERRRLLWKIRHTAPEAYVTQITEDRWGTRDWEDLPTDHLRKLCVTVVNRNAQWHAPKLEPETVEEPF